MSPLPDKLGRDAAPEVEETYLRTKPRLEAIGVSWDREELIRQYCISLTLSEAAAAKLDPSNVTLESEKTGGAYINPALSAMSLLLKETRVIGIALGLVPKPTDVSLKPKSPSSLRGPSSFIKTLK